jgi:hypothetical protein
VRLDFDFSAKLFQAVSTTSYSLKAGSNHPQNNGTDEDKSRTDNHKVQSALTVHRHGPPPRYQHHEATPGSVRGKKIRRCIAQTA